LTKREATSRYPNLKQADRLADAQEIAETVKTILKISEILSRASKLPISVLTIKENLELKKAFYQAKLDATELRMVNIRESISSMKSLDNFERQSPPHSTNKLMDLNKINELVKVSHFTADEDTKRGFSQPSHG
jgi:DNA-binding NarL/FixJ family response regulator